MDNAKVEIYASDRCGYCGAPVNMNGECPYGHK